MRKHLLTVLCFGAVLSASAAEATITDVTVRQRWPWSAKVDVDFTVHGTNCDIEAWGSADGVAAFRLAEKDLAGDVVDAHPGARHFTWDPVSAGLGDAALRNFSVTLTPRDMSERTYLILDLTDGSYEYAAAAPVGGWIAADSAYYLTKMVFRRIPAGTFFMGVTDEIKAWSGDEHNPSDKRTTYLNSSRSTGQYVTISRDYYLNVYLPTAEQILCATGTVCGTLAKLPTKSDKKPLKAMYNAYRGSVDEGIDWPTTPGDRYKVTADSILGRMRRLAKLPANWVLDLATGAQWERAAKAEQHNDWIFPNGGTVDMTIDELWAVASVTATSLKQPGSTIGTLAPNAWGLYDMCGLNFEWCLDYYTNLQPQGGVDPVGNSVDDQGKKSRRYRRNYSSSASVVDSIAPAYFGQYPADNTTPSGRLCIHLHRIGSDN